MLAKLDWKRATVTFLVPGLLLSAGILAAAKTYQVAPGDTLYLIAQRNGLDATELAHENGLSSEMIYPGQTLKINNSSSSSKNASGYRVQPGDSLYLIAARYGTTVEALKAANGLSGNYIESGQRLTIPGGSGGTGTGSTVTVRSGDTLYLLATRYGTSVAALKSANGLTGDQLYPGQQLRLPSGSSTGNTGGSGGTKCTVKSGDTLYLLAVRYGTTVSALRQTNGLSTDAIYPGQILVIPGGSGGSQGSSKSNGVSQSDLELLARLVSAESASEPYAGQVAVAATILNRLNDPKYPKSIAGIIYQYTDGAYQYSPVMDGRIDEPAGNSAIAAVQDALNGWDPSYGATGFYNPSKTDNPWVQSQPVTTAIGDHVFFRY